MWFGFQNPYPKMRPNEVAADRVTAMHCDPNPSLGLMFGLFLSLSGTLYPNQMKSPLSRRCASLQIFTMSVTNSFSAAPDSVRAAEGSALVG
jgi:hypothetical protein